MSQKIMYIYTPGLIISSVTTVTLFQPSYAHKPEYNASAIPPGLNVLPSKPLFKLSVLPVIINVFINSFFYIV